MAHQLLKDDGRYDRGATIRRANSELRRARRLRLDWDRAKCLEYVWGQARTLRARFLGGEPTPVKKRKLPRLNGGGRRSGFGNRRLASVKVSAPEGLLVERGLL